MPPAGCSAARQDRFVTAPRMRREANGARAAWPDHGHAGGALHRPLTGRVNLAATRSCYASGMAETFITALPIDDRRRVTATRIDDVFAEDLPRKSRHWVLPQMEACGYRPHGFRVRSMTGTDIGYVIRCVGSTKPDGSESVTSRDYLLVPVIGPIPRQPVKVLRCAVTHLAFLYSQATHIAERKRAAVPMDPADIEALRALTPDELDDPLEGLEEPPLHVTVDGVWLR